MTFLSHTCPGCGVRWTLTLNPGSKPMPWHDDPRCADCRTPSAPLLPIEELVALEVKAGAEEAAAAARSDQDRLDSELDAALADNPPVMQNLICPRCAQPHQRRGRPGDAPLPDGHPVVCGSCRGGLRSATVAARPEDGLPVGDNPGPWITDGLCAQTDPELFHPEKGGSTREAKAICARCPVIEPCREWALTTGQAHGIWGGLAARERRDILQAQRAEAVAS